MSRKTNTKVSVTVNGKSVVVEVRQPTGKTFKWDVPSKSLDLPETALARAVADSA